MTTNDIDAIRKLTNAATRGPWSAGVRWEDPYDTYWLPINAPSSSGEDPHQPDRVALIRYETCGFQYPHADAKADAEFIAAARTLVPALCDEVEHLREQVFAQKPVMEAAQAWAEMREMDDVTPTEARKLASALHDAIEQYRLMDLALTTARAEQAEVPR